MLPYFHYSYLLLGPIKIQIWGIFFVLGVLTALVYLLIVGKGKKISQQTILDFIFWATVGVLVGGRIGYILAHLNEFGSFSSLWTIWDGGMALYGGFFGGLLTGGFYIKHQGINIWKFADIVAPAIALSLAIGRIGCYLTGEHIGGPTNFILGVRYEAISIHQTSIYSIIMNLFIFAVLSIFGAKKKYDGQIILLFLLLYAPLRFVVDSLRADEPNWWTMTPSQWISIPLFAVGLFLMNRFKHRDI